MATVMDKVIPQVADNPEVAEEAPKFPWLFMVLAAVGALALFGTYRWYQLNYSFEFGLDYFEPEFQTYWMDLFWAQMIFILAQGAVLIPWLWFTRDPDIAQKITPSQELKQYYYVFGILAVFGIIKIFSIGLFTEADAAWHQVTVRDTDFTPTHIALFYFALPLDTVGAILGFVWIHTRMPQFVNRISIPLAVLVAGPILIMPNLGFNEWGHTFFYAEELFAAPVHWGFVVLGWASFGIAGFFIQCFGRMSELTELVAQEAEQQAEEQEGQAVRA